MNSSKDQTILTVSQLTKAIKNNLESEYRFVRISGEISNLKTPYSGHSYFTLKDSNAQIRGVLFKQQKRYVSLELRDGQDVICFGRVTVYEPRGDYQLIVDSVEMFGKGKLQKEFEALKEKLAQKGYFDREIKKELPAFPRKIIVISSATGAALQDFLKIVRTRKSPLHIQILPVLVQGKDAPADISKAIQFADTLAGIDAIVLCRGGGSLEDLWGFNAECVADAIFQCKTPIITGIGHEVDFTVADFCADFRAPTPTAAAEVLTSDSSQLLAHIALLEKRLKRSFAQMLSSQEIRLNHSLKLLSGFGNKLNEGGHRLTLSKSYLIQAMSDYLSGQENRLQVCQAKLAAQAPLAKISVQEKHLLHLKKELIGHIQHSLARHEAKLGSQAALLNSVSPLATLARGYSVVRKKNTAGKPTQVVTDSSKLNEGDILNVLLHKGDVDCVVLGHDSSAT
ncbi:MAG: exodeoxyribonuclease VII large subunit [Desulfotalea sp.]|nr:MAG: exodeoxyribonuclease VII large subunit [Desulfotalea sp.]